MLVKEMIERLERCNPEDRVVIEYDIGYTTVGALPGMGIKLVCQGFDWEKGTVRITPDTKLCAPSDQGSQLRLRLTSLDRKIGQIYFTLQQGVLTPPQRLKEIAQILNADR